MTRKAEYKAFLKIYLCNLSLPLFLYRAVPLAYGSSQARCWILNPLSKDRDWISWVRYHGATMGTPIKELKVKISRIGPQIWRKNFLGRQFAIYTTAHGNAGSLTHWVRPGMEPTTSWFLVRFASAVPWWELQGLLLRELFPWETKSSKINPTLTQEPSSPNWQIPPLIGYHWNVHS